MLRKLFKSEYILSFLNKGSSIFFGMVTAVCLNRYLGPELKGEYAQIMVYVTTLPLILDFGIYQAYPYFRKKYGEEMLQRFTDLSLLQFIIYMVIAVIACFFAKDTVIILAILTVPIATLLNQVNNLCLAVDVVYRSLSTIVSLIVNFALTFTLFIYPTDKKSLVLAIIIFMTKNIMMVLLFSRKLPLKTAFRSFDFKLIGEIIRYGFFPMLSGLLIVINFKLDIIFLSAFNISDLQIGLFSTALSIIEYMAFIPGVFNDVLYNHAAKTNPVKEIVFSIKTITLVTLVVGIAVAILANPALTILYGEEFSGATPIIWVLLPGRFSLVFFKLIGTLFLSDNKRISYFLTLLLSFALNAALNPVLIPLWGVCGSAAASVIAEIIASGVFLAIFIKSYKIPVKSLIVFEKQEINSLKMKINKLIGRKQ